MMRHCSSALLLVVLFGLIGAGAVRQPGGSALPVADGTAKITVAQPDLAWFLEGRIDILKDQLRVDPRWRVWTDPWAGDLVAHQREGTAEWDSTLHGMRAEGRVMYRFSAKPEDFWKGPRPFRTVAGPEAGEIDVQLSKRQALPSEKSSYLCVGAEGLWLEVLDRGKGPERTITADALREQAALLKAIRASADEIKDKRFAAALLPANGVRRGKPSLKVSDMSHPGLRFRAWVNPGKPGYVFLKLFRASDGEELSDPRSRAESREETGWSTDPEQLFYAEGEPLVYGLEGSFSKHVEVRAELWFRPQGATDESLDVKLLETTQKVMEWER